MTSNDQLDPFKTTIKENAMKIVHDIFPQKINYLHEWIQKHKITDMYQSDGKKRKLSADEDSCEERSDQISKMFIILKKELLELIEHCNTVKIWIQLNIPRIEDGNNFGVSIQVETVTALSKTEESSLTVLDSIIKYYAVRGKLESKMEKYPRNQNYSRAIIELDDKEMETVRLAMIDIRNDYAILYDMIHKNMDKIMKPKSLHNLASLY